MGLQDDPRTVDYLLMFPKLQAAREAAMLKHLVDTGGGVGDSRYADYVALAGKLKVGSEAIGLAHLLETQDDGGGDTGGDGGDVLTSPMRGMNVPINQAFASFVPFANVIHKSREWTDVGTRNLAAVDDQGVPIGPAESIVLQDNYPAGVYTYEGCELSGSGVITAGNGMATLSGSGIVQATHSGLLNANTQSPVPSVVWLPVELWSEGKRWNTTALTQLTDARIDTIRMSHWMRATYSHGASPRWGFEPILSERLTPEHTHWSDAPGMPWEIIVDFVRKIGAKRVWLNPPIQSPADYLTKMAEVFSPLIDEGIEVIVEDGIELWNGKFPGTQLAASLAPAGTPMPEAVGYGIDSAATCAILQTAFGSRPWSFAMMGHAIRPEWLQTAISAARAAGLSKLDYVGCAGYLPAPLTKWKALDQATQLGYSTSQVIADMREGLPAVSAAIAAHKLIAEDEGAKLAVYEAGPIVIAGTSGGGVLPIAGSATKAYRSDEWGDLFVELADLIKTHDPAIVCWFNWMNPVAEDSGSVGFYENHTTISPMGSAFLAYEG